MLSIKISECACSESEYAGTLYCGKRSWPLLCRLHGNKSPGGGLGSCSIKSRLGPDGRQLGNGARGLQQALIFVALSSPGNSWFQIWGELARSYKKFRCTFFFSFLLKHENRLNNRGLGWFPGTLDYSLEFIARG